MDSFIASMLCSTQYLSVNSEDKYVLNDYSLNTSTDFTSIINPDVTPNTFLWLGENFFNSLTLAPYFYSKKNVLNLDQLLAYTTDDQERIEFFLIVLWFIKDNSVNQIMMTSIIPHPGRPFIRHTDRVFSNAKGQFEITEFSLQEWQLATDIYEKLINEIFPKYLETNDQYGENNGIVVAPSVYNDIDHRAHNRISRAFTFLQMARMNSYLPAKLTFYVMTFECLFSANQKDEVTHKIAERVAYYIAGNPEQRISIFKLVKKAYGVRSSYAHGQKMAKNLSKSSELMPISVEVDNLLRNIFNKIILSDYNLFLSSDDVLNDWFTNLIFSYEPNADTPEQVDE